MREVAEGRLVSGPVVQGSWIEISAIWPDDRVDLRVDPHLAEHGRVSKRPEHGTGQDAREVDAAFEAIVEPKAESERPDTCRRMSPGRWDGSSIAQARRR